MKKKLILVIAVLLLLGGAAFVLSRKNDKSTSGTLSQKGTSGSTKGAFDAIATTGSSFSATITSTANGKDVVATMEYDKNTGNIRYTSTAEGQNIVMIYTKDAYYMCQSADKCFRYPITQSQSSGFDPKTYQYSDAQLATWRNSALDQGKKPCPSGTCYVWKVSSGGYDSAVYIDTKTKRVVQVESTTAAGSSKIVYDYKDVSITPPANAQALPTL